MADKFEFELVSPEKLLISEPVDMVVVPGGDGDFGVLPGHAALISTVRPGTIEVYEGKTVARRIFVHGGFAEVTQERCTVLAEHAEDLSELNRGEAERSVKDLAEDLADAKDEVAKAGIEKRLNVARARLDSLNRA